MSVHPRLATQGAPPALDGAARMLAREVLEHLRSRPKRLPCKLFYDARGSLLFEEICELPEYYLTRAELGIMKAYGPEMAASLGSGTVLVEFGSGSSLKTRLLLSAMAPPVTYVPIDISATALNDACARLRSEFPRLSVLPVRSDYTREIVLPPQAGAGRRTVYFPGSTIGNFTLSEAREFLLRLGRLTGPGGQLLIGFDLQKDPARIHAAYNDARGVTAAFNKNLLVRLNRELAADFDLDLFEHRAFYDPAAGRIEMHLSSRARQTVIVAGEPVRFEQGETILTEYSYKYTLEGFADLANSAGFRIERTWTDPERLFCVELLVAGS
jgi:dimethylhistidine N-methyltransferase